MKYVNCNVCGADNWFVRYRATLNSTRTPDVDAFRCTSSGYGEHTQIVQCHECTHVYANPTWDSAELLEAYETVEDTTYVEERSGRELTFRKHLQAIEAIHGVANGRTFLDVGAYIGVFVEVAQSAGWQARGVEPSSWGAAQAQARGLDVIEGTLSAPELADSQYDLITIWDVIEHLEDPKAEVEKAFNLTSPGGMIAVHTMDVGSWTAKLMGSRWPWYMAMHVQFFNRATLTKLLEDAGYKVQVVRTEGRFLRMGYLVTRLGGLHPMLGKIAGAIVSRLGAEERALPINFGDLFTVYAIRPK